jgi:hypothetical protein
MRIRLRILLLLSAGLLLFCGQALAATPSPEGSITPFLAQYRISIGNVPAGEVEISLELDGNGNYRYRQHSIPVGLLAVFKSDEITEVSEGLIRGDRIIPSSYRYQRERSKKPKKVHLIFDWEGGRVTNQVTDSHWSLEIPDGTQDRFSKQLAMIVAMNGAQNEVTFQVADDERIKTYHFRPRGIETIETERKKYDALKIERSKGDRPSRSTLWLAPELRFLPVKVERLERGNLFVMELVSVQWLGSDTDPRQPQ